MKYLLSEKSLLSNFKGNLGEDDYKEPLSFLLDSLNQEAKLNLIGKFDWRGEPAQDSSPSTKDSSPLTSSIPPSIPPSIRVYLDSS